MLGMKNLVARDRLARHASRRARQQRRLRLESLEDRRLLATVGYYDMSFSAGRSTQVPPIVTAGETPVPLNDLTSSDLAGIDVLFVQNPSNSSYGGEYLSRLSSIQSAVANGMVLILHDRYVANAESILPGGAGFNVIRSFSDSANINVVDNSTLVTNGPGGIVNNSTLDNGCSSSHGFAVSGSLPGDSVQILSRGNPSEVVTFSYEYGDGAVVYSSIPLDAYLGGLSCGNGANIRNIYAPNVVAYGVSLLDADVPPTVEAGPDQTAVEGITSVPLPPASFSDPRFDDPVEILGLGTNGGHRAADAMFTAGGVSGSIDRGVSTAAFNAMSPAQLRSQYDVILVTWSSDPGLNLDWNSRLLPYMNLGGSVIWEDPNNLSDIASIVSSTGGSGSGAIDVIASVPGLTDGILDDYFDNNHITFGGWAPQLSPFLRGATGGIVGLYGQFGQGRIVLTGPDQDYHASRNPGTNNQANQYNLLVNEIAWVLGDSNGPGNVSGYTASINWGDGTGSVPGTVTPGPIFPPESVNGFVSGSHVYADDGIFPVTVAVTDPDGATGTDGFSVTVANVPPTITPPADQFASEGVSASLNLGSFTDPGDDDPWSVTVDWGDGATTNFIANAPGSLGNLSHTYEDDGTYPVTVTVTEDNGTGDAGSASFHVTVGNATPDVALDPLAPIDEGQTATLTGSFTDLGLADDHTVTVDWDDPNAAAASTFALGATSSLTAGDQFASSTDSAVLTITGVNLATGTVSFSVSHAYLDDGPAGGNGTPADNSVITVTVDDGDSSLSLPDFSDTTGLALNGDAATLNTLDGDVLRLATASFFSEGTAYTPFDAAGGFSSSFRFRITNAGGLGGGADGLTFTLQSLGANAVGTSGGNLAVGGISPSVSVEFDTYFNPGVDPSSNHVGVDVNGSLNSVATLDVSAADFDNGDLYHAWVDYDGQNLEVRFSTSSIRPAAADLSYPIDLAGTLGGGTVFAGFTAATGGGWGNHDIVSWDIRSTGVAQTSLRVNNVAPEITSWTSDSPFCGGAAENETVHFNLAFDDPGTLDTHEVVVDYGDGQSETVSLTGGERTLALNHAYATGGVFSVSVSVADDDEPGNPALASTTVVVTGVGVVGDTLYVVGTDAADQVSINQTGNGTIKVHADFLPDPDDPRDIPAAGVAKISVILCGGDDHATISDRVSLPAIMDGGEGNDHLNAGGGGSVLLGGGGDDHLNGGSGLDILIGGTGRDRLVGNAGEDVLIGGGTAYDSDPGNQVLAQEAALCDFLEEWAGPADRDDREAALQDLANSILDDGEEDVLTGASGEDLFFAGLGDQVTDANANNGNGNGNGRGRN